ncbi:unnamed protein product [Ectocarpus sp. 6 AP-2014]
MEEWKRAKGLSEMTFPKTKNVGLGKNCPEIHVKMRIRMMVAKTRTIMVKVLLDELEYKVIALVDASSFLLLLLFLSLIRRIV